MGVKKVSNKELFLYWRLFLLIFLDNITIF